jgi:hypothetical protein
MKETICAGQTKPRVLSVPKICLIVLLFPVYILGSVVEIFVNGIAGIWSDYMDSWFKP